MFFIYLFIYYVRGTRERILILLSKREKSRFFVKTANWPPLEAFSVALGVVFVYIGDAIPMRVFFWL